MTQKAHLHLIKYALAQGCTISVDGGGDELDLTRSSSYQAIKDDAEACDITWLIIERDHKTLGTAMIVNDCSFEPEEYVADYSDNDFMNAWNENYTNAN